jgi:hypothetical protein
MIRLAVLLVFLAGLGHIWLHHAHAGDNGHFGAAIEKACPSEKLVADNSTSFVLASPRFMRDCEEPASDCQRRYRHFLTASPRGPPHIT